MDHDKSFIENVSQSAVDANVDVLYLAVDTLITSIGKKSCAMAIVLRNDLICLLYFPC